MKIKFVLSKLLKKKEKHKMSLKVNELNVIISIIIFL